MNSSRRVSILCIGRVGKVILILIPKTNMILLSLHALKSTRCTTVDLSSVVTSESILSREGLLAGIADISTLALMNRCLMALEVMLAGEGLLAVVLLADKRALRVGIMGSYVRAQVEEAIEGTAAVRVMADEGSVGIVAGRTPLVRSSLVGTLLDWEQIVRLVLVR